MRIYFKSIFGFLNVSMSLCMGFSAILRLNKSQKMKKSGKFTLGFQGLCTNLEYNLELGTHFIFEEVTLVTDPINHEFDVDFPILLNLSVHTDSSEYELQVLLKKPLRLQFTIDSSGLIEVVKGLDELSN